MEISLIDQNGVTFTALINAKSWRKAETDATTFSDWGGAVSGKLGQPTDNGFEVVDAGIKVFEKKAKEPKPESTTNGADAAPVVWPGRYLKCWGVARANLTASKGSGGSVVTWSKGRM